MTTWRLIFASLIYHIRQNIAVAMGVAAGTAVITGALLVGDSMHGSLRHLALDRLGHVDDALVSPHFFRTQTVADLAAQSEFQQYFSTAVPAVVLQGSLESADQQHPRRANRVQLLGCPDDFWNLGPGRPATLPTARQVVLNRPLADQLGVKVGDTVLVRLPQQGTIPADTALGRKQGTVEAYRVTVSAIIPAEGLGQFSLQSNQQVARNAYLPLSWLQERLNQAYRANALFIARRDPSGDTIPRGFWDHFWRPTLADAGIRLEKTAHGYFNLSSERMLLDPAIEKALMGRLKGETVQPTLTYLANTIACGSRTIPYSTITAIDFAVAPPLPLAGKGRGEGDSSKNKAIGFDQTLGPMLAADGKAIKPLSDNEIVLNRWAADDLHAKVGDTIRVTFFEPETTHGTAHEQTVEFRLVAVAEMKGAAVDRAFTPDVPGITDQRSMSSWDAPFPFDAARVRPQDDRYWETYRATPKAFVSLAAGRQAWANRFGQTTTIRIQPRDGMIMKSLAAQLSLEPDELGLAIQPVKQLAMSAAAGTTPFNVLFLAFSSFVIAAAVMLVMLLFRLAIDQRASEIGSLLAMGFRSRQVSRMLAIEGFLVTALGSFLGLIGGIGYAALMLLGLRTWWLAAVVTPFLRLYVTPTSLAIGYLAGVVVAFVAIVRSVQRAARASPHELLAGITATSGSTIRRKRRWLGLLEISLIVLILAASVILLTIHLNEEIQAAAFFGVGALTLVTAITIITRRLRAGRTGDMARIGRGNLMRLALRNVARNPLRSSLTIGLVASAAFLVVSVSAFHIDPAGQAPRRDSGDGGFALVAESDQPIYQDLNTPVGRREIGFSATDEELLAQCEFYSLRVKPGDDASCLNLYQPRQPRVLGLPQSMIDRGGFAWDSFQPSSHTTPWQLLEDIFPAGTPIVLEKNTAMYSLHLWNGVGSTYSLPDGQGNEIRLKVVGLLNNSIFQGDLLMGEQTFLRRFPNTSGYRFFLIAAPLQRIAEVRAALERVLGDYGFVTESTGDRLAGFLAVQNTYLSTFQSLGALGLLLGTFGMAAVQLRNVFERRGELAILRAVGFQRRTLAAMVLLENALLLVMGLGAGVLSALVALLPHLFSHGAAIPWLSLAETLAAVLIVGLLTGLIAVRATMRSPLLVSLRRE